MNNLNKTADYYYTTPGNPDKYYFRDYIAKDLEQLASTAGRDYFENVLDSCDNFPLLFTIYDSKQDTIGTIKIIVEFKPYFKGLKWAGHKEL